MVSVRSPSSSRTHAWLYLTKRITSPYAIAGGGVRGYQGFNRRTRAGGRAETRYIRRVPLTHRVLALLPSKVRSELLRRREVVKFLVVGGTCFLLTTALYYGLTWAFLEKKPVTALTIATIISAVVSYFLNRAWSFRTRGGRRRHHEAFLFFLFSAVAVGVTDIPLAISRYVLHLHQPYISHTAQQISDFVSGIILGTLIGMAFRLWTFRRFVFPVANARPGRRAKPAGTAGPTSTPAPVVMPVLRRTRGTAGAAAGSARRR
jgi:putative flippase GtrA